MEFKFNFFGSQKEKNSALFSKTIDKVCQMLSSCTLTKFCWGDFVQQAQVFVGETICPTEKLEPNFFGTIFKKKK